MRGLAAAHEDRRRGEAADSQSRQQCGLGEQVVENRRTPAQGVSVRRKHGDCDQEQIFVLFYTGRRAT